MVLDPSPPPLPPIPPSHVDSPSIKSTATVYRSLLPKKPHKNWAFVQKEHRNMGVRFDISGVSAVNLTLIFSPYYSHPTIGAKASYRCQGGGGSAEAQGLQCVAVCCSVLQCVAVCCSVFQCVALCCSVLQCVAVCCSVLQCAAV